MSNDPKRVDETVERARKAQKEYEKFDQAGVDRAVDAVAWALMEPERNQYLSELAVKSTGLGNVADKMRKNHRKTLGLLRDLKGVRTVGVINEMKDRGLIEIARPMGVIGAIVPSTNPVATPTNNTINAVKGRNAIVLAPSPKGEEACAELLRFIHAELDKAGAPRDIVIQMPRPTSKSDTEHLMKIADQLIVTGSQRNVRQAYSSGTPAIGVGAGNVTVIVDETADLAQAANKIRRSKTFDNATSCSSENSVIVVDGVYDAFMAAMKAEGGVLLDAGGKGKLTRALWPEGKLNGALLAKDLDILAAEAGLETTGEDSRFFMVEDDGVGPDHPYSGEKMSLVLSVYRAADYAAARARAEELLGHQGGGHSLGIHTADPDRPLELGLSLPTCRVIVNQAHCFATGGSFDNGMPFSLSMGCGTWGGNSISDNLNYRHFLNITRIVNTIPDEEPALEDIFGDYWRDVGK